jgi:hypothetical protein
MVQLYSFAALRVPPVLAVNLRAESTMDGPDDEMIGHISGPEVPLAVEFVGISEEEQRAALAAFPGGRRFQLVTGARRDG